MRNNENKNGISLIVLVITIVVVIILAAAVILSLNNNNPITNAKKASFQSDVRTFEDELNLYIADQYAKNMGVLDLNTINAQDAEITNKYIKSMKPKYYPILEVVNGKLVVRGTAPTGEEKQWAEEILGGSETGGGEADSDPDPYPDFGDNGSTVANVAKVNNPVLTTGLTPIIFDETEGKIVEPIPVESTDSNWYVYVGNTNAYGTDDTNDDKLRVSKWANAQSVDGSQWVWIPRYAYKIPSGAGTNIASPIEVAFLKGTSDNYYDQATGTDLTAKRVGEVGAGVAEYMVHPAFTNENNSTQVNATINNGFKNGGWDSEITGMWVAKYEAGFAAQNGIQAHVAGKQDATIVYPGTADTTKEYPVFKPNALSYGRIDIGDTYALSRVLNSNNNPYGLTTSADTHLIKDSEWGSVAYLTQSKYGRNGTEIRINNINSGSSGGLTGAGATTPNQAEAAFSTVTVDNKYNGKYGKLASTTGNLYGIYDLSGGNREAAAGYLKNNNDNLTLYGKKLVDINNDGTIDNEATKYIATYELGASDTGRNNFAQTDNKAKKGEAIWETSNSASSRDGSWNSDNAVFLHEKYPFFYRGGDYHDALNAGAFNFNKAYGNEYVRSSFRPVFALSL